jgi:hypothetical protein
MSPLTPRTRRRRSARCRFCKEKFRLHPGRGRPPSFCSASCRQRDYERRKWQRPHPVDLLARDINTVQVKDLVRRIVREVLTEAGIILPPPPPKKPKRRDHLRVVPPET